MSASAILHAAFDLDRAGREAEAIPLYRKAIKQGLSLVLLRHAMICLGSSLQTVGDIAAAQKVLQSARKKFPGDAVVVLLLALVERDAGNYPLAIRQLAHLYLSTSKDLNVTRYGNVLRRKFHAARGGKPRVAAH